MLFQNPVVLTHPSFGKVVSSTQETEITLPLQTAAIKSALNVASEDGQHHATIKTFVIRGNGFTAGMTWLARVGKRRPTCCEFFGGHGIRR